MGFVALSLLGSFSGLPNGCSTSSRLHTSRRVGGGNFTTVPLMLVLVIGAALLRLGATAFRRRDLQT